MGRKHLSEAEITRRLVRLRNLERLHAHAQQHIVELKAENKELRTVVASQDDRLNTQAMQIAELQAMVFGKKKKPPAGTVVPVLSDTTPVSRSKASYRRPIPPASAVTSEVAAPLPETCACGGSFDPGSITIHDRYQEYVPLPELTPAYQPI